MRLKLNLRKLRDLPMSKSYKFRGEVVRSYSKKKLTVSKEKVVREPAKVKEEEKGGLEDSYEYEEWEDDGDFEKFDRKR